MQKLSSVAIACRQCGQVVRPCGPALVGWRGGAVGKPATAGPPASDGRGRGGGGAADRALMKSAAVANRLSRRAYARLKTSSSHLGTFGFTSLGRSVPAGRSP